MRKLSLIAGVLFLLSYINVQQNPHGEDLKFDCADCHTTQSWTFSGKDAKFSHDSTSFVLEGRHLYTNCKSCHTTLIFSQAKSNCIDCHNDLHNNTLGLDCARCHSPQSWLVQNITEIHQQSRFPLLGAHNTADCSACHISASLLEFQPLGVECIDCHRSDYLATTNPNHVQAGISTNCIDCHKVNAFEWTSKGFNHDFFPLIKGHAINNCTACHKSGQFEQISTDCYSCHQQNFVTAVNPSHQGQGFSTNCLDCHTTDPDWKPAKFDIHDNYFPIYSGRHRGEWDNCATCHTEPTSYALFSCITCHEHDRAETDGHHREVRNYVYSSTSCYTCHPTGRGDD